MITVDGLHGSCVGWWSLAPPIKVHSALSSDRRTRLAIGDSVSRQLTFEQGTTKSKIEGTSSLL